MTTTVAQMKQLLLAFGYVEAWHDEEVTSFHLADCDEIIACLDHQHASVAISHNERCPHCDVVTILMGADANLDAVAAWLQSANAKNLYRSVDSREERRPIK